ncbi:hypothetical protein ONA91_38700 [Micromonospora sp. DR5-3]|uniref:hypothetical protein n=1 Tax=unclassified Micromonospora TaxID=2617518 RepID=UPI0011DACD67|nr:MULTISPECIES: hypothetical protein [unclassified Micromonospora]MCW3820378.1 hypothetical protein [Micromonospora sp. DR5-3]TYC19340.1 hypothetical protein FXF52_37175 [Micromonospora sp. MP36]
MSTHDSPNPQPATLESVLRDAWDAFHPGQPAPLGWLTHTTTRIHDHLRAHQPAPTPPISPPATDEQAAGLRRQVWQTLRDAASDRDIDPDAAERILHTLDLPGLPRRWQIRLTLPLMIEVTASGREDALDTAEDLIDTALTGIGHDSHIDWHAAARDDTTPGDVDPAADEPADLR